MKLDFQSLSAEPLVYMLMQSGAFVTVLGIVFFLIGLLFGYASWGRYKGRTRQLRAEAAAMKEELASLKRKLGELSVKSGPAVPMVTEMITLPKKESPPPGTASSMDPGSSGERGSAPPASAATAASVPQQEASDEEAPALPEANFQAEAASNDISAYHSAVTSADLAGLATTPPEPAPAEELPAAISGPEETEPQSSLAKDMLVLPEIPISTSPRVIPPRTTTKPDFDFDSQLGLVYKSKPEQSDDLTALKGVAPNLEHRLHTLGVYTYEQVAGWTQDQVREFSARLAFKDRIQREQWVEQARELLADRHERQKQETVTSGS